MNLQRKILLSFDAEEFDMPLEYGHVFPEGEQLRIGKEGLDITEEILRKAQIPATFFTTAFFAGHFPEAVKALSQRHEIASHTFYHSAFETGHLLSSRLELERITGKPVTGLRMPRMREVSLADVKAAGYQYDSSLNPTWLPGRYNHFRAPRAFYMEDGMLRIPASVSTPLRIPLFWLSFKNFPFSFFLWLTRQALKRDKYVVLYLHPWEFTDLSKTGIPGYTRRPDGILLREKLEHLISNLKKEGDFITMQDFAGTKK